MRIDYINVYKYYSGLVRKNVYDIFKYLSISYTFFLYATAKTLRIKNSRKPGKYKD